MIGSCRTRVGHTEQVFQLAGCEPALVLAASTTDHSRGAGTGGHTTVPPRATQCGVALMSAVARTVHITKLGDVGGWTPVQIQHVR